MTKKKKGPHLKTGRPTKFTPKTIDKLKEAFALGCSNLEACILAEICESSLINYQNANPEFLVLKAKLKENPILLARQAVIKDLEAGNVETAKWMLERKKGDEFGNKAIPDLVPNIQINIGLQDAPNVKIIANDSEDNNGRVQLKIG